MYKAVTISIPTTAPFLQGVEKRGALEPLTALRLARMTGVLAEMVTRIRKMTATAQESIKVVTLLDVTNSIPSIQQITKN